MARTKETVVDAATVVTAEKPIEAAQAVSSVDSPAKAAFRAHLEAYKKQNPIKYELKKEALLKKLNTL